MGNACHLPISTWMGARQDDQRCIGSRVRRGRGSTPDRGGLNAAVVAVSAQRGSYRHWHEEGRMDQAQRRKRFQGTAHGRRASLVTAAASAHAQEASLVAACSPFVLTPPQQESSAGYQQPWQERPRRSCMRQYFW